MEQQSPISEEKAQVMPQEPKKEELPLHPLEEKEPKNWIKLLSLASGAVLLIAGGVITGNLLASGKAGPIGLGEESKVIKTEKVVGSTDTSTFRDSAEGVLENGGIDGEGTHHLVRAEGRPDQNAYLTSSVVDLDQYAGKKVKVWGETFTAQKAGWLMDVGKIELLE